MHSQTNVSDQGRRRRLLGRRKSGEGGGPQIHGLSWGLAVLAAASALTSPSWAQGSAAASSACPAGLPERTACYAGQSADGAWFSAAYPPNWNGVLVLYAHGGPRTERPQPDDPGKDLERFSYLVGEGYAWAASTYRREGYGVRSAAEDTEQLREILWARFGRPRITLLHGASWGANVAAKTAELYGVAADGRRNYDGVVLTSGFLSGGSKGYQFRADLRAVYQFYCRNHPRPDEEAYPVWQGLPQSGSMSRAELAARVEQCTGLGLPPEQRSATQASALRNILAVTGIRQSELVSHLAWATSLFQDMVWKRLGGRNPFDNSARTYVGSDDDAGLNEGVERFRADPGAVAALSYDSDLSGMIAVPVLTVHARYDPTVSISHAAAYRDTVTSVGRSELLVQAFTRESVHHPLSSVEYVTAVEAMRDWIEVGQRPSPISIARRCEQIAKRYTEGCHFDPEFSP